MNLNYLLVIPIIICILNAVLSKFLFKNNRKLNHIFLFTFVLITSIIVWILLFTVSGEKAILFDMSFAIGEKKIMLDISFKLDGLGKIFVGMVSVLWPLATLYAFSYMENEENPSTYFMFYTLTYAVLLGISFSANLFTLYIFYECLTFATLPLIIQPMTKASKKAGRIYMYYSLFGTALVFAGLMFILFYSQSSDFNIGGILDINSNRNHLLIAYFVCFMGFGVKSAIFPLHVWLPLAGAAPTPTTALLHAVAVVKAGVFALMRLTFYVFQLEVLRNTWVQTVTMSLAIFTIIYGSARALKETHFKRRFAYSTISNLSYIVFGITLMTEAGLEAGMLHLLFHSISKITLFFACGIVMHKAYVTYVYELDGLGRKMPIAFGCFLVSALSLTGIPFFAGFISKYYLAEAALSLNSALAIIGVVALIISALLTAIYSLVIPIRAFVCKPNENNMEAYEVAKDGDIKFSLPIIIFSVLCIVFGVCSSGLVELIQSLIAF